MNIFKTSKDWYEEIKHKITILDYDGFNRDQDFEYFWNKELITEADFNKRLCSSTIIWDVSKL